MPVGVGRFHVDRRQARYDRLAPRSIHGTSIDPPLPSLNELDSATGTRMRCATLQPQSLLAQEVPLEVVSELLGHSSIRMTKDVYRPSDRESEAGRCRIDGAGIVGLMCPNPGAYGDSPHDPGLATQSCALMLHGDFQTVDSIGEILEPTFGVDVEPIEDLYGVIVGVL